MFIWNAALTACPVFWFAKSGKSRRSSRALSCLLWRYEGRLNTNPADRHFSWDVRGRSLWRKVSQVERRRYLSSRRDNDLWAPAPFCWPWFFTSSFCAIHYLCSILCYTLSSHLGMWAKKLLFLAWAVMIWVFSLLVSVFLTLLWSVWPCCTAPGLLSFSQVMCICNCSHVCWWTVDLLLAPQRPSWTGFSWIRWEVGTHFLLLHRETMVPVMNMFFILENSGVQIYQSMNTGRQKRVGI